MNLARHIVTIFVKINTAFGVSNQTIVDAHLLELVGVDCTGVAARRKGRDGLGTGSYIGIRISNIGEQ